MSFSVKLKQEPRLSEFRLWLQVAESGLSDLPDNVLSICEYGFTEMLNNATDHSGFTSITLTGQSDLKSTTLTVSDDGLGLFNTLSQHFDFYNNIEALIDLVKGKLTTSPDNHSGEGIFFCSKLFDTFSIQSGELFVEFNNNDETIAVQMNSDTHQGTQIKMTIGNSSERQISDVFNLYCNSDFSFSKTRFAVSLGKLEGNLMSRSQAKRISNRFDLFESVQLDFSGVNQLGQGFTDELFRVWPIQHPSVTLITINVAPDVEKMINHVRSRSDLPQAQKY